MCDPETPKRKNTPRRFPGGWFVLVSVGVVCFVVGIYGFWKLIANSTDLYCFGTLFPSETDIEQHAFFEQPPSAHNVEYATDTSNGCVIWVSFEMDPDDFQHFQESIQLSPLEPGMMRTDAFLYPLMKNWKTPESFAGNYGLVGPGFYPYMRQLVVVDTTNPAQLKVYIVTYNPCPRPEKSCTIPL